MDRSLITWIRMACAHSIEPSAVAMLQWSTVCWRRVSNWVGTVTFDAESVHRRHLSLDARGCLFLHCIIMQWFSSLVVARSFLSTERFVFSRPINMGVSRWKERHDDHSHFQVDRWWSLVVQGECFSCHSIQGTPIMRFLIRRNINTKMQRIASPMPWRNSLRKRILPVPINSFPVFAWWSTTVWLISLSANES